MSKDKFLREDKQLDELFRSSLEEIETEPSAGVWNKLDKQMMRSELTRFQFTNFPKAYWGIIPLAMILTGAILYFGIGSGESLPEQSAEPDAKQEVTQSPSTTPDPATLTPVAPEQPSFAGATTPDSQAKSTIATSTEKFTASEEEATIPEEQLTPSAKLNQPKALPGGASITTAPLHQSTTEQITSLSGLYPEPLLTGAISYPPIESVTNPFPVETNLESLRKPQSRSLDFGINITPDMVFYNSSAGSFKYNYTFDLGARLNLGRFYIQSGAGLTYSSDIGDYAISYLKNDSIGYYYTINSFSVEPGNPEDPQFESKQVTVYDSVQYYYDYSTKNKYYYLQIPLSAGYRIINKPSWRLSVEAGLLYAYLVSINEPAPTFYIPEGRILDIERQGPKRNKHSFGVTAGVSVEYQFARNFFLLIEPTFKYYLQAIDENSSRGDKQPYSIGLRAGIWYRLDFKNRTR